MQEALRFVELEHTLDKYSHRSFLAECVVAWPLRGPSSHSPELLLYDSPTGGLDPITSTTIIELVVKQRDVYGGTALLVTHRLQDAFTLATHTFDRVKRTRWSASPTTG